MHGPGYNPSIELRMKSGWGRPVQGYIGGIREPIEEYAEL